MVHNPPPYVFDESRLEFEPAPKLGGHMHFRQFAMFFENLSIGIKWGNDSFGKLMGIGSESLRAGVQVSQLRLRVPAEDLDRIMTRLEEAKRTFGAFSEIHRLILPDGAERLILGQARAFRHPSGDFFAGTLIDLSPKKLIGLRSGSDALDDIAVAVLAARQTAGRHGLNAAAFLLDMTLLEVGNEISRLSKRSLRDRN